MKIIGHEKQLNLLKELAISKAVPHAMLFNGDEGIGKKLVALKFAKTFYCEKNSNEQISYFGGCDECKSCKLFDNFSISDFYFIECSDKEQIKTENIRELLYNLNLKNFSAKNKFVIFNDAHLLKEQSANILLKTLEEPKDNTYFILVTSNYSKLPITIISRCQLWFFDSLKEYEIIEILNNKNINLNSKDDVKLLEGSLTKLDMILNNENVQDEFQNNISDILNGNVDALNSFVSKLVKNKDNLKYNIGVLRNIIRNRMLEENNPEIKNIFAITLENLIYSEYLIFERYLNSQDVLNNIFSNLLLKKFVNVLDTSKLLNQLSLTY